MRRRVQTLLHSQRVYQEKACNILHFMQIHTVDFDALTPCQALESMSNLLSITWNAVLVWSSWAAAHFDPIIGSSKISAEDGMFAVPRNFVEPHLDLPSFADFSKALQLFFEYILDSRAKPDALSWSDPTVFILYTHANETLGDAKSSLVGRIIRWLQRSRCRVISDRSPLDRFSSVRSDDAVVRNILDSQFHLLPFSGEGDSVAKVVLCGSDVLGQYCTCDIHSHLPT